MSPPVNHDMRLTGPADAILFKSDHHHDGTTAGRAGRVELRNVMRCSGAACQPVMLTDDDRVTPRP